MGIVLMQLLSYMAIQNSFSKTEKTINILIAEERTRIGIIEDNIISRIEQINQLIENNIDDTFALMRDETELNMAVVDELNRLIRESLNESE